jgi:hypothetical protein
VSSWIGLLSPLDGLWLPPIPSIDDEDDDAPAPGGIPLAFAYA